MVELPRSASRGGREARRSKRGDPGASRAIRAGLTGGQYRPLSKRDIERIHQTVLDVLEKIGMGDAPASIRDLALANGAVVSESGRARCAWCRRRRSLGGRGLVQPRAARLPALHASGGTARGGFRRLRRARSESARRAALGEPRRDPALAQARSREPHAGSAARPVGHGRFGRRRETDPARTARWQNGRLAERERR